MEVVGILNEMDKCKIKVLPLEGWMKEGGLVWHSDVLKHVEKQTEPIINRDGYYLYYGICWFENKGKAYVPKSGKAGFMFHLRSEDIITLREEELQAISILAKNRTFQRTDNRVGYYYNNYCMLIGHKAGMREFRKKIGYLKKEKNNGTD